MKTYVDRLTSELDNIKLKIDELLENSRIMTRRKDFDSQIIMVRSSRYWDKPTEKEQALQISIKKIYNPWIENLRLFTENSPEKSKKKIEEIDKFIIEWVEKENDWGIPSTINEAKNKLASELSFFYDTLKLYSNASDSQTILIPDTNGIIQQADPAAYKALVGVEKLTIVFLPTILSELDELKMKSSNPEFQKKVKSVITRLKGYRQQGNMTEGVIVEKTILLKMVGAEPDFSKTLKWLDKDNNDDRIIASALEIQRENPSSNVCVVTSDINLQNKAEMARLSYIDVD